MSAPSATSVDQDNAADTAVTLDSAGMICAACGKTGDGLKKCANCKSVRYCDTRCMRRHRKAHRAECERLAREVKLDAAVAAALDAREECPICALTLPLGFMETKHKWCCGKVICSACHLQSGVEKAKLAKLGKSRDVVEQESFACPFCRAPSPISAKAALRQTQQQADRDDPRAIHYLAMTYFTGGSGVRKDERKALELFMRASELGHPESIGTISDFHGKGLCGLERDEQKRREYLEKGASLGCHLAHFNLGIAEWNKNNPNAAMYYMRISASIGGKEALEMVKVGYKEGHITKDEFAKTLRSYQRAQDDMHSDMRDLYGNVISMSASSD